MPEALARVIDAAWEARDTLSTDTKGEVRDVVDAAIDLLDKGEARVAEKGADGSWTVHQWLKKAVLLSFRLNANGMISGVPGGGNWWDKVPSKFEGWGETEFRDAGFRAVPPCAVRRGAFVAKNAVLMPSYVNIGAYVGEGTMIDTWASVGSCAQVGANCHISAGTGIGGVLEPLQANPTIIEDNCFIRGGGVRDRHGRVHHPVHQDREPRDRRDQLWPRAALLRRRAGHAAGQKWRAEPRLRRHRENRRRANPRQDRRE